YMILNRQFTSASSNSIPTRRSSDLRVTNCGDDRLAFCRIERLQPFDEDLRNSGLQVRVRELFQALFGDSEHGPTQVLTKALQRLLALSFERIQPFHFHLFDVAASGFQQLLSMRFRLFLKARQDLLALLLQLSMLGPKRFCF